MSNEKSDKIFGPSRISVERKASLKGHLSQGVYRRSFKMASYVYHGVGINLRMLLDDVTANRLQSIIDLEFDIVMAEMDAEIKRLKKLADDEGCPIDEKFSSAENCRVTITSPRAGKFLTNLSRCDELEAVLGALWFGGVIDEARNIRTQKKWKEAIGVRVSVFHQVTRDILALGRKELDEHKDQKKAASRVNAEYHLEDLADKMTRYHQEWLDNQINLASEENLRETCGLAAMKSITKEKHRARRQGKPPEAIRA